MKMLQVLNEQNKVTTGTNCYNCKFIGKKDEKCSPEEQNPQGGIKASDEKHLKMAEENDLVTLPGNEKVTTKRMCMADEINQHVTERMCCALWDGPGTLRDYKK